MHVVGMLINGVTGEILNAGKSGITSGAGVGILNESVHDNLKIYPNPGSQYVNIIFKADNSTSTIIDILNSAGQVVKSENIGVVEENKINYFILTNYHLVFTCLILDLVLKATIQEYLFKNNLKEPKAGNFPALNFKPFWFGFCSIQIHIYEKVNLIIKPSNIRYIDFWPIAKC